MKTFYDLLKEFNPELNINDTKNAFITEYGITSYRSLNQSVIANTNSLKNSGIKKDDIVPILCNHSLDFIISVLSLWMIEAIPVPINIRLSESEIEEQIKFLKPRTILIDDSFKNKMGLTGIAQINLSSLYQEHERQHIDFSFDPDRTAVILFTSGSSGNPKAVELSFSNLINSAIIGNKFLRQTSDDRWLASLPFYHIGGFSIIFRALMYTASIIIPKDLKIESLIGKIKKFNPTLLSLVSNQMQSFLDANIQPNSELKHVLLGGGFIASKLMEEAITKGWKVSKVYGSTETSSFVTLLGYDEFHQKPESVGKATAPNEVFILDENGNGMLTNSVGEIVVKSPAVMKGYCNDEESTKKKLRTGLYFTEDFGYKDSEGYLYVVNRRSDLIVTGGENVNPLEVEKIISKYPKVREVCVVGIDDEIWGQKVIAAIVSRPKSEFSLQELKDFLKDKLASFKIPKEIFFVDELPKTELGKIRREHVKKYFGGIS